jgi:hypothetical protein
MKKLILLLLTVVTIQNVSYAAFPIIELMPDPNEGLYKTVGYFMGVFMLIFGVIIAYAYNNKTMVRAAWKGFLTVIGAFVLYLLILFSLYMFAPGDFSFLD